MLLLHHLGGPLSREVRTFLKLGSWKNLMQFVRRKYLHHVGRKKAWNRRKFARNRFLGVAHDWGLFFDPPSCPSNFCQHPKKRMSLTMQFQLGVSSVDNNYEFFFWECRIHDAMWRHADAWLFSLRMCMVWQLEILGLVQVFKWGSASAARIHVLFCVPFAIRRIYTRGANVSFLSVFSGLDPPPGTPWCWPGLIMFRNCTAVYSIHFIIYLMQHFLGIPPCSVFCHASRKRSVGKFFPSHRYDLLLCVWLHLPCNKVVHDNSPSKKPCLWCCFISHKMDKNITNMFHEHHG